MIVDDIAPSTSTDPTALWDPVDVVRHEIVAESDDQSLFYGESDLFVHQVDEVLNVRGVSIETCFVVTSVMQIHFRSCEIVRRVPPTTHAKEPQS